VFDPGLAGLFITSTLLYLGEDINLLVVSRSISRVVWLSVMKTKLRSDVVVEGFEDGNNEATKKDNVFKWMS